MRPTALLPAITVFGLVTTACGAADTTSVTPQTATIRGALDLNDSHGGVWAVQHQVVPGAPCSLSQDLVPGFNLGTRAFPPDAQVVVKNEAGTTIGATSLDTPKSGVLHQLPSERYYCEFTWKIVVPVATLYSFEFPGATPQRFAATSLPNPVDLAIGDGIGFGPGH